MICNWTDLMMRPLVGYTLLYMYICLHDHTFGHGFCCMVILRSTTGSYGQPMIEVAYRKTLFSLHRGCMGDDSSGRVVGVST